MADFPTLSPLPVDELRDNLKIRLQEKGTVLLSAPTGSGKSTRVPRFIQQDLLTDGQKVIVLQPRRVAARALARRVAQECGQPLGGHVGYTVRFDDQTSPSSRILFMTEGILLQKLRSDLTLKGVGAVVFDEFHERRLWSDLLLGLMIRLRRGHRPDLRLVVMSATLEMERLAGYFEGGAGRAEPVPYDLLETHGRAFPVDIRFEAYRTREDWRDLVKLRLGEILASGQEGDVLVFLPGKGEIRSAEEVIRSAPWRAAVECLPLHAELPPAQQDKVFEASDRRKVILATNVAETSITVDGVRFVIDTGTARVARFLPERGVDQLMLEEINRQSADQRAGRAGRTAPGVCFRLWDESNHLNRPEALSPEVHRADLAEVVLRLLQLGVAHPENFPWVDAPEPGRLEAALTLLLDLGAIQTQGDGFSLTEVGDRMGCLPVHPRWARMLVAAADRGVFGLAALASALASGRDGSPPREVLEAFREDGDWPCDWIPWIRAALVARDQRWDAAFCSRYRLHPGALREAFQSAGDWCHLAMELGWCQEDPRLQMLPDREANQELLSRCLMQALPDQLAGWSKSSALEVSLANGVHATMGRESLVADEGAAEWFVVGSIRQVGGSAYGSRGKSFHKGRRPEPGGTRTLALGNVAVKREWIEEDLGPRLVQECSCSYEVAGKRVSARRLVRWRELVLESTPDKNPDPDATARCLVLAFRDGRFQLPNLKHELVQWFLRLNLVHHRFPELELPETNEAWVDAFLTDAFRGLVLSKDAQAVDLRRHLQDHVPKDTREWVETLAPARVEWTDGRSRALNYRPAIEDGGSPPAPEVQVPLQECFSLDSHPAIGDGTIPVVLDLRYPNGKALETTEDWLDFRKSRYPRLKRQLEQKFPGLAWPMG